MSLPVSVDRDKQARQRRLLQARRAGAYVAKFLLVTLCLLYLAHGFQYVAPFTSLSDALEWRSPLLDLILGTAGSLGVTTGFLWLLRRNEFVGRTVSWLRRKARFHITPWAIPFELALFLPLWYSYSHFEIVSIAVTHGEANQICADHYVQAYRHRSNNRPQGKYPEDMPQWCHDAFGGEYELITLAPSYFRKNGAGEIALRTTNGAIAFVAFPRMTNQRVYLDGVRKDGQEVDTPFRAPAPEDLSIKIGPAFADSVRGLRLFVVVEGASPEDGHPPPSPVTLTVTLKIDDTEVAEVHTDVLIPHHRP